MERRHVILDLLRDQGFHCPEEWVNYANSHNFTRVQAHRLMACPDCASRSMEPLGQFVYYSNLVHLQLCRVCGLIFSSTRIDPHVISKHFECAYKDEAYFQYHRSKIFEQLANEVGSAAPGGGRVLDIGGAKGHLMARVKQLRPDLRPVVNDLSREACEYASAMFGVETIVGAVDTLEKCTECYDVIVMSDVAYYEPELKKLWDLLPRLLADNGTVIIRVPNKLPLILFWQKGLQLFGRSSELRMQSRIRFFNPEHLYVFSRQYLNARLRKAGFTQVRFTPSQLLMPEKKSVLASANYRFAQGLAMLSAGRLISTPSMLVTASGCKAREMAGYASEGS